MTIDREWLRLDLLLEPSASANPLFSVFRGGAVKTKVRPRLPGRSPDENRLIGRREGSQNDRCATPKKNEGAMADQTFYVRHGELAGTNLPNPGAGRRARYSSDTAFVFKNDDASILQRGLVCGCYAGEFWSITARTTGHSAKTMDGDFPVVRAPRFIRTKARSLQHWPGGNRDKYDAQNAMLMDIIWECICKGRGGEPRSGLIVVAGTTGCGKTTYARALALRSIAPRVREALEHGHRERPHVVTYEDPIESWFAYSPTAASEAGFEYTPREKGKDVSSLQSATEDALRQKPALFYVGEVRSDDDWRTLLAFAGTGHLVLTTTHAGSLSKALERILRAVSARTPADRSDVGRNIAALMHVRDFEGRRVPSLWVQTPRSRAALTHEGLASLLPTDDDDGRYGRRYFARKLPDGRAIEELALQSDLRGD